MRCVGGGEDEELSSTTMTVEDDDDDDDDGSMVPIREVGGRVRSRREGSWTSV
jgi:hypothetical protein